MKLTTGVQATVRRATDGPDTDPSDIDVRAVLYSAYPVLFGLPGIVIEHVDGPDWLVTIPTIEWERIESEGHFEWQTLLGDSTGIKLEIAYPY